MPDPQHAAAALNAMPTLSRRCWLAAVAAMVVAGRAGAATATEERPVAGFDAVLWDATGELVIAQSGRERLTIEAEPAVLARIVADVRGRRLHIGFAPGRPVQTQQPIRFRLDVKTLAGLETRGSGAVQVGPLAVPALTVRAAGSEELRFARIDAQTLAVRLEGAGSLAIAAGRVDRQQVVIAGAAMVAAAGLESREADVAIDGSGEVRVAATERLAARIAGSGDVLYRGRPQVAKTVTGAGDVRPLTAEDR